MVRDESDKKKNKVNIWNNYVIWNILIFDIYLYL